jgi:3-hydroxyisobutyrate dehydrogenase-like beta-hydroxyacid dehydrogenase
MARIAFLGLGAMGMRMARKLIDANHTVTVWNRNPERTMPLAEVGAKVAKIPREAADGAEIVIAMVRDDDASRMAWLDTKDGAVHQMASRAIATDSSTLTVSWTRELASALKQRGVDFLDAPVVGSRPQAEAGQLIQLIGGDKNVLARAEPVFKAFSSARHWCGPNGAGAAMKLAVNALFGIQVAALAELVGLLQKDGIESAAAVEVLGALPVLSPAAKGAGLSMVSRTFAPMFPVELVEKDFGYAVAAARSLGVSAPVTTSARAVYATALEKGFASEHITSVFRLYE